MATNTKHYGHLSVNLRTREETPHDLLHRGGGVDDVLVRILTRKTAVYVTLVKPAIRRHHLVVQARAQTLPQLVVGDGPTWLRLASFVHRGVDGGEFILDDLPLLIVKSPRARVGRSGARRHDVGCS